MTDLRVATVGGAESILEGATVQSLRATLHGPLLCPGDAGYDEERKVWNGMIDRRPALIARCVGVADVIAAVNFARTQQVLVSVRGGGHDAPGERRGLDEGPGAELVPRQVDGLRRGCRASLMILNQPGYRPPRWCPSAARNGPIVDEGDLRDSLLGASVF